MPGLGGTEPKGGELRSRNASGTTAADEAPAAKRFHFGWGVRLAVLLCGVVVALVLAAGAGACASLQGVKAFEGHVTEHAGATATGLSCPDCGGATVGIQLGHVMHKVHVHIGDKRRVKDFGYDFKGGASSGMVAVDDGYEDTGADYRGEVKYHGPLPKKHTGDGLIIIQHHHGCDYNFGLSVYFPATYEGDPEINPGRLAGISGASKVKHLPNDLILSGSDTLPIYPSCSQLGRLSGCAQIGSDWVGSLVTLQECGYLIPPSGDNCDEDLNKQLKAQASFSWHLHPVFQK